MDAKGALKIYYTYVKALPGGNQRTRRRRRVLLRSLPRRLEAGAYTRPLFGST